MNPAAAPFQTTFKSGQSVELSKHTADYEGRLVYEDSF